MSTNKFSRPICFGDLDNAGVTIKSGTDYTPALVSGSGDSLYPAFQHVFQPANDPEIYEPMRMDFDIVHAFQNGSKIAYDSGRDQQRRWNIGWRYVPLAEKNSFEDWFLRVGKHQSWTFTDPLGSAYTVRFIGDLSIAWNPQGSYMINIVIEEEL